MSEPSKFQEVKRQEGCLSVPRRCCNAVLYILSNLFFWWVNPIIKKGMKAAIAPEDLFELPKADDGGRLRDRFYACWNRPTIQSKRFRLWAVILLIFRVVFIYIIFLSLLEAALKLANTLFLGKLLEFFEDRASYGEGTGHLYAGLLSGSVILYALVHHQLYYHSIKLGMSVVSMMISVVFRKITQLQSVYSNQGYVINLVSNDTESFRNAFTMIHSIVIAPLEIVSVTFFLVRNIGWVSTLAGLVTLFLMIPIQALLSKWIAAFRKELVHARDVLLRTVSDTLSGIQVIKYYSWEAPFQKRIHEERAELLKIFYKTSWIKCFNESCAFFSSLIVSTVAFVTYYHEGNQLTASKVFPSLSLFFLVQVDITDVFPRAVEFLVRSFVSVKRLEDFLDLPQVEAAHAPPGTSENVVHLENCMFKWPQEIIDVPEEENSVSELERFPDTPQMASASGTRYRSFTLDVPNLEIPQGQITIMIGPVGSGKSTMFSAMLGEIKPLSMAERQNIGIWATSAPSVSIYGMIGYVSQQPWLFHGTLLENVLLGRPLDPMRLARVISVCSLKTDLQAMPLGLNTFLGERGVSLSGGQRARISLARTLYDYDKIRLFLLDDVLSAVDNIVGNDILGRLKELCRETGASMILVTHQTQHIDHGDRIISLNHGRIVFDGTPGDFFEQEGEKEISVYGLTDEDEGSSETLDSDKESSDIADSDDEGLEEPSRHIEQPAFLSEGVLGTSCTTATMMHRVSFVKPPSFQRRHHHALSSDVPGKYSIEDRIRTQSIGYRIQSSSKLEPRAPFSDISKIERAVCLRVKEWKKAADAKQQQKPRSRDPDLVQDIYQQYIAPIQPAVDVAPSSQLTSPTSVSSVQPATNQTNNIAAEDKSVGKISYKTYLDFMRLSGSPLILILLFFSSLIPEALFVVSNEWLALWCESAPGDQAQSYYPIWLIIFTILTVILSIVRAAFFFNVVMHGCVVLFEAMLASILSAPIAFFQTTPIGRILNRFSKDQAFIDEELAWTFFDAVQCSFMVLGTIVVMCVVNFWVSLGVPFLVCFYAYVRHCYLKSSREIKRCESVSRSPVYSMLASTLEGLVLVRSFPSQVFKSLETKFVALQNMHTRGLYSYDVAGRWLAFWLDISSSIFVFLCAHVSVVVSNNIAPAMIGFALSYVVYLIGLVQWCTRQLAEVENMMTSVERIMTYAHLPSEQISLYMDPPRISKILSAHQIPKTVQKWNMPLAVAVAPTEQSISPFWPEHGNIIVQNLNLTLPTRSAPILNGITCSFEPKEKIAIVGRTGAGKSSFLSAFLRLVEPWPSGCITIDGVNISLLPLSELRRRISIIPQDPILFHGSIRFNLDPSRPSNSKDDEELWQVLEQVRLSKIIRELPDGLDSELNGSGTSIFSMGEKQLFCLARAILRKSRLIFMDEATANIDMTTSDYIQTVIHKAFSDSNVFTIAHRLQTVIHYDRVMVLDQGKLVELDTPWNLVSSKEYTMPLEELALLDEDCDYWGLEDPVEEQSLFAKMIRELGPEEQKRMRKAAFDHYYSKQKTGEDMIFDNASI